MISSKISGLLATVLTLAVQVLADQTCQTAQPMEFVGRDGGGTVDWCSVQINSCKTLCGGNPLTNTCDGTTTTIVTYGGTFCYECTCSDGSTPPLANYFNTIPGLVCGRALQNCEYGYDQFARIMPEGACGNCAYLEAGSDEPTSSAAPAATTSVASSASAPIVTTSTSSSSSVTTSTSSSSSVTTSTSSTWVAPYSTSSSVVYTVSTSSVLPANTSVPAPPTSNTTISTPSITSTPYTGSGSLIKPISALAVLTFGLAGHYLL